MAQWVKHLLCKQGGLRVDSPHPQEPDVEVHGAPTERWEVGTGESQEAWTSRARRPAEQETLPLNKVEGRD